MFKKTVIGVLLGLACLWVAKKTQLTSYASTMVAYGKQHVRKQIPRDVELARVQHEIDHLDRDYRGLLGPIAEKMAGVKKLEQEIVTAKFNLQQQRDNLLNLTKAAEGTHTLVATNGHTISVAQAKAKLDRDFATFKKLEAHLSSRDKLLEAEIKSLAATQEQLEKLVVQKREFEIRLAQLEADEATLKVARIKAPLHSDSGRVSDIKKTLERIAQEQQVEQYQHQLQQQYGSKIDDAPASVLPGFDLREIREYLQSKACGNEITTPQGK